MTAIGAPAPSPRDALAAFVRARRDTLINELARDWAWLGRAEVEDAVDEAVARATASMQATREQAVYDYIRTAAYRRLNRRKRQAARMAAPVGDSADFDRLVTDSLGPDDALIAKEHRQLVLDIAASLDERTRTILRLKHVDGLERKQVAATLGISEKAVKKAIEKGNRICRDLYSALERGTLCGERRHALDALIGGQPTEGERDAAEAHLAHCEGCRSYRRTATAATRAAAALAPLPLAPTSAGRLTTLLHRIGHLFDGTLPIASGPAVPLAKLAAVAVLATAAIQVPHSLEGRAATAQRARSAASPQSHTTTTARVGWANPPVIAPPAKDLAVRRRARRTRAGVRAARPPRASHNRVASSTAPVPARTAASAPQTGTTRDEFPVF